jgi:formylglycine-generating enzyme required for sulfatase activity
MAEHPNKGRSQSDPIGDGPYRLPTEAEWEYAARAGTDTARYWGDSADVQCDFANGADAAARRAMPKMIWSTGCDDGYAYTAPVGSFPPNAFGLYEMLGNAYQWTADCWSANYEGPPLAGDGRNIPNCGEHVVRGGSWSDVPGGLRAGNRSKDPFGTRDDDLGFRVAKTLAP